LVAGFSLGGVRKRVGLAFSGCFIMTSAPPQQPNFRLNFGCILGWNVKLQRPRSTS